MCAFHTSEPTDVLWIGLNDQRNQMLFEWSDHSHVTFTQWQSDEPSHATNYQEDCIIIQGKVTLIFVQMQKDNLFFKHKILLFMDTLVLL